MQNNGKESTATRHYLQMHTYFFIDFTAFLLALNVIYLDFYLGGFSRSNGRISKTFFVTFE